MRKFVLIALPLLAAVRVYDYVTDGRRLDDLLAVAAFLLLFGGTFAEGRGAGALQQRRWRWASRVALFAGIAAFILSYAIRFRLMG